MVLPTLQDSPCCGPGRCHMQVVLLALPDSARELPEECGGLTLGSNPLSGTSWATISLEIHKRKPHVTVQSCFPRAGLSDCG